MKKRVKFYTLGCKTNQYETQAIKEMLESTGAFAEAGPDENGDIFIVNTCTVTAKADKESRWIIRRCHRESPEAEIVVTGCLTEIDENMIRDLPGVSVIVRNNDKDKIANILTNDKSQVTSHPSTPLRAGKSQVIDRGSQIYTPFRISDFVGRDRAFIKVQDGCDNFCSYCKVPLVRGTSRSRGLQDILEETERLLERGFKELVLTGICLGDWGRGLPGGMRLHNLVEKIDSIDKDFRVRLSSIEPNMVTRELIESIAASKKICPHLHIPLQSGSDKILKSMNRPYTAGDYIRIIKEAKRAIKDLSITSDIMIAFPGESERDFKETIKVLGQIGPSRVHIFSYSERGGTQASRFKSAVSPHDVKKRREAVERIANASSYRYRKRFVNRRVEGLVESRRDPATSLLTGYTAEYIRFLLDGPDSLIGKLVPLKVQNVDSKSTYCKYLH
ncbi:tRNA (N(6)-L-threonylcarbamoyladenosine(37)-C(2))-methylthiotransferase MtaB [Omnitrophica bacterium]|nr:tRNA (N(6)-L-threonylcarbamoyladenosine(37)-C(2))-methylthiotransferase MtaB [Candidatus Omnitrophota bacterium]